MANPEGDKSDNIQRLVELMDKYLPQDPRGRKIFIRGMDRLASGADDPLSLGYVSAGLSEEDPEFANDSARSVEEAIKKVHGHDINIEVNTQQ